MRGVFMKNYKKAVMITLVLALIMAFPAQAFARDITPESVLESEYNKAAVVLNELGLFRGSEKGFELERAPNRTEAAVMMIRLLGKEEAALATSETHPFADVPAWADKYIAYMFATGLTKGTGATTFGSADLCTAQMYVTMVLRALGYDDAKGDFTYNNALVFARMEELVSSNLFQRLGVGSFVRGDMVLVSFSALFTEVKGGEDILLEKLVAEKSVETGKADKYLNGFSFLRMEAYNKYLESVSATYNSEETETIRFSSAEYPALSIKVASVLTSMWSSELGLRNSLIVNYTWPDGAVEQFLRYIVDDYVYVKYLDGIREKLSIEDYFDDLDLDLDENELSYTIVEKLDTYSSVNIRADGNKQVVSIIYKEQGSEEAVHPYINFVVEDISELDSDDYLVLVRKYEESYTFHPDGYIESTTMSLDADYLNVKENSDKVTLQISQQRKIAAPDTPVTVDIPDLKDWGK
jgi:hypothetical protein